MSTLESTPVAPQPARRELLRQAALLSALASCGLLASREVLAVTAGAFDQKTLDDAFKALGGKPQVSDQITITSPDIAENGAVVPIAVASKLANTQEIYIVIEKNPMPLTATFTIADGAEAFVATRAKMGQSSDIYAVVKADGKLYSAVKETKVTLGGCGG